MDKEKHREISRAWYQANKDTEAYKARRDAYNAYRRSEEYKAKRRATRDLVKNREDCKKYAAKNKEKIAARQKIYNARPEVKEMKRLERKEKYFVRDKQRALDGIKNLSDNYVKSVLVLRSDGLSYSDIPQAMVEAKRLQILIRREVLANTTKEQRNKEAHRKYLLKNPTAHKDYYLANKEKCALAGKAWREKNKERLREKNKEYAKANREKRNAQARARYDPEKQKIKNALYREAVKSKKLNQEGVAK